MSKDWPLEGEWSATPRGETLCFVLRIILHGLLDAPDRKLWPVEVLHIQLDIR